MILMYIQMLLVSPVCLCLMLELMLWELILIIKQLMAISILGNANVKEGKLYDTIDSQQNVQRFNSFFNNKSRIFDDGYGQIWA